ncbi:cytochrome b/b6 domain-containing protein [Alkalinema pantanalense CENA528]|uniref:cytochrome b/b6 domain-containing protein n=1 Tax=Alkalinema pantanalense TaxID=1620705 RepID=UPI003D6E32A0
MEPEQPTSNHSSSPSHRFIKQPTQATIAKIVHWINIISLILMIGSGLQIYNANPVFGGREGMHIPKLLTLGGWLAGGRNWHFAVMWVYSLNLLVYGCYIFMTRRWKTRFAATQDLKALKASANPKRKLFAGHKLVYTLIIPPLLLAIVSGLAMYKPAQLYWLVNVFGSWQNLRIVHFITIPIVLGFVILHSFLSFRFGGMRLIRSMFF